MITVIYCGSLFRKPYCIPYYFPSWNSGSIIKLIRKNWFQKRHTVKRFLKFVQSQHLLRQNNVSDIIKVFNVTLKKFLVLFFHFDKYCFKANNKDKIMSANVVLVTSLSTLNMHFSTECNSTWNLFKITFH